MPLNPNIKSVFIGLQNYIDILKDPEFYKSLGLTVAYTALVVVGSTGMGLLVAIFFNREFRFRRTARSLIILSYVTPSISLIFAWKYMFNNGYGVINFMTVDVLHMFKEAPLWFDNPVSSFFLVTFLRYGVISRMHLFRFWRFCKRSISRFMRRLIWTERTFGINSKLLLCQRLCRYLRQLLRFVRFGCSICSPMYTYSRIK